MGMTALLLLDFVELGSQALGRALAFDRETVPIAASTTQVDEPQEIEGLRLAPAREDAD
jgi:hypothetical protein